MDLDWKDALQRLKDDGSLPEGDDTPMPEERPKRLPRLRIYIDRRQRRGKTATIIEGFESEEQALETARALKQSIGCGGSARGGEILLQGDRCVQARNILSSQGFRTDK